MYVLVDGWRSAEPPTNSGRSSAIRCITFPEWARVAAAPAGPAARTSASTAWSISPLRAAS